MKTKQNLNELDIELDLFDINDWDFSKPYENNVDFNDRFANDSLFDGVVVRRVRRIPIFLGLGFVGIFFALLFFVAIQVLKPSEDYLALATLTASEGNYKEEVNYVDGEECSNEVIIRASKLFSTYFSILNVEKGYDNLDSLCLDKSTFYKSYKGSIDKMQYSYDEYDCYARLLSYFGSYCRLNKIQKVIKNNNVYYCYLNVTVPSEDDIASYIRLYSYNFTKKFTMTDATEANIVRYLYSMEGVSKIPCSEKVLCITMMEDNNGNLFIYDDTPILNICVNAYSEALSSVANLLGSQVIQK